jgi:hypothetical protein
MDRPQLQSRDRLRVELRLPAETAETVYRCARGWDVSLSEAGTRLIESGAAALGMAVKTAARQSDLSRREREHRPLEATSTRPPEGGGMA